MKLLAWWGVRYLRSNNVNYSKRDHFLSEPTKCVKVLKIRSYNKKRLTYKKDDSR